MDSLLRDLAAQFLILWAVIDPIGTIPVFLAKTVRSNPDLQRSIALKATIVSAVILLFFLFAGKGILTVLQIPLSAFQIAGSLVLLLFALTMIFGESKPEQEIRMDSRIQEVAIFPIAVPSIASPGAMMTLVMISDKYDHQFLEQIFITLVLFAILMITYCLMILANRIQKLIGTTGALVVSRIMGLILAAVAVNQLLSGIQVFFSDLCKIS